MAGRRTTRRTRSVSPRDGQPPIRHELSPTWYARPAARRERPRHGMRRTVIIVAVMLCAAIALFASIPRLMRFVWPASGPEPRRASDAYCSATLSSGDNKEMLSVEQALNAEIITRAAVKRGLPDHAATFAIATAMQETRLMNLSYGDRDSVGLFQQRPSQGWGTKEQLMDETYAANRFYDELVKVPNWQSVPVEDAAQSVQRSQYPDRYADWTSLARTWAAGLTGETGAGVACALEPAQPSDADVDGLTSDFRNEFPTVMVSQPSSLEPSSKTQDDGGDKAADNSAANDGSGKTTSKTLTFTMSSGTDTENGKGYAAKRRPGWWSMHGATASIRCARTACAGTARTACGPAPRPEISPSRRRWPDSGRCHDIHTRRPAGIRRLVPSHGQRAQSTRACSSFAHRRRARQSETLRDTPELRSRTASTHPGKRPCSVIPAEHVRQSCYTIRACRTMNPVSHSLSDPISPRGSHHRHRSERSSDRRPRTADVHRPHL